MNGDDFGPCSELTAVRIDGSRRACSYKAKTVRRGQPICGTHARRYDARAGRGLDRTALLRFMLSVMQEPRVSEATRERAETWARLLEVA